MSFYANKSLSINNTPPAVTIIGDVSDEVKALLNSIYKKNEIESLISSSISPIQSSINSNNLKVDELNSKLNVQQSDITSNKDLIDTNKSLLDNNIKSIKTNVDNITSNLSSITSIADKAENIITRVTDVGTLLSDTINNVITPNISNIQTNKEAIDVNKAVTIDTVDKLKIVEDRSNSSVTRIDDLTSRITATETILSDTINNVISPNVTKINNNISDIKRNTDNIATKQDLITSETDLNLRKLTANFVTATAYAGLPIDQEIRKITGRNVDGTSRLNLEFGPPPTGGPGAQTYANFHVPVNIPSLQVGSVFNDDFQRLPGLRVNVQEELDRLASSTTNLNNKQDLLSSGSPFTINVGRGGIDVESNQRDRDTSNDGAGLTFRTSKNPTVGSIFAIRDKENNSKLWVGSNIVSVGVRFQCGYKASIGEESVMGNYAHAFDKKRSRINGKSFD